MSELLQKILTDPSARSAEGAQKAAASPASTFVPWNGDE